jgi:hypothetical protein
MAFGSFPLKMLLRRPSEHLHYSKPSHRRWMAALPLLTAEEWIAQLWGSDLTDQIVYKRGRYRRHKETRKEIEWIFQGLARALGAVPRGGIIAISKATEIPDSSLDTWKRRLVAKPSWSLIRKAYASPKRIFTDFEEGFYLFISRKVSFLKNFLTMTKTLTWMPFSSTRVGEPWGNIWPYWPLLKLFQISLNLDNLSVRRNSFTVSENPMLCLSDARDSSVGRE